jgi:hypothetical protein
MNTQALVRLAILIMAAGVFLMSFGRAEAKEVGGGQDGPVSVKLYDDVGHCKDGATVVVARPRDKPLYTGCWFAKLDIVWILWDDQEFSAYPRESFKFHGV